MADKMGDATVRAIRDQLLIELERLDSLGERMAAIELNSAIEILNDRLGEDGGSFHAADLERRLFRH